MAIAVYETERKFAPTHGDTRGETEGYIAPTHGDLRDETDLAIAIPQPRKP